MKHKPLLFTLTQIEAFRSIIAMEDMCVLKEYLQCCYPKYIRNGEPDVPKLLLDIIDLCKK